MTTKKCATCGEEKPLDSYYNHCRSSDGLQSACKPCKTVAEKQRRRKLTQKRPVNWTAKEDAALLLMRSHKVEWLDIAKALNRSYMSVKARAERLRLKNIDTSEPPEDVVDDKWPDGMGEPGRRFTDQRLRS